MCMGEQNCVVAGATEEKKIAKPELKTRGVAYRTGFDQPFEAMRVAECTDRIRR